MDTQSKDILKQILGRVDSQQQKLDRVMESLDTLQNIIEQQNKKQNLLDDQLLELTIKRQQEKADMIEQLQEALQEIVEPFHATDTRVKSTPSSHVTTQPLQSLGSQIGEKLQSIEDRTFDTAQKCHQLTSWTHKMEYKMTELASNSVKLETCLLEIRSATDLMKGQTNSELMWLNNLMDKELSNIGSVVTDIYHQQTETKEETLRSMGYHVNTDMQHGQLPGDANEPLSDKQLLKELCDKQMQVILDLDRKVEQLNSSVLEVSKDVKGSRNIYQDQTEAKAETVRSTGQHENTDMQHGELPGDTNEPLSDKRLLKELCDKQMQVILDLDRNVEQLNSSVLEVSKDIKGSLDTILTTNTESIKELENTMINSIAGMKESSKEQSILLNETLKSDLNKHFEAVQSELQTNRNTVITESETLTNRIIRAAETVEEELRHPIQTEGDNTTKDKVEMESLHSLMNSLINKIQEYFETTVKKVNSTEASIISKHQTVNTKLTELNTDLKDYIYKTKREIFAVTEKEAQIVRDRIQGPLASLGKYTFDLYVNNFRTLVRAVNYVDSLPWHINEVQTCVTGRVTMLTNGEMKVWLVFGRHPLEVGLQPRSRKTLKVKATICDIYKKKLPPVDVGEKSWSLDEAEIPWNGGRGIEVGVTSCDFLLKEGYGKQEGYFDGALLIRYEVTVQ